MVGCGKNYLKTREKIYVYGILLVITLSICFFGYRSRDKYDNYEIFFNTIYNFKEVPSDLYNYTFFPYIETFIECEKLDFFIDMASSQKDVYDCDTIEYMHIAMETEEGVSPYFTARFSIINRKARKDILEYNDNIFSSVDYIIDVTSNENVSISSHKLEMSNKYLYSIKIDKNDATNLFYLSVESSDDALCQNIVTEIVNLVR